MAQQANVTLNSVVYAPGGTHNGISIWTNRSGGFGASFTNLKEEFVQPAKGDVVRMKFSLDIPIVATTDTACGCAGTLERTSTCQISVWVPQSSTAAERADLLARITSLVASAPFTNGVGNLDPTWG
jgi:hypothetical protein